MFNFKTDFLDVLYDFGVYDVVLPFLLVFTLVFAFLQKTKILGTIKTGPSKGNPQVKYNMIVALVMGILALRAQWFVYMIHQALPKVGVTIIGILMFFILVSMFTGGELGIPKAGWIKTLILVAPAIAVLYYFLSEVYGYFPYFYFISDNIQTIIVIAVFALIIFFIVGGNEKTKKYPDTQNPKKFNDYMWRDFLKNQHNTGHTYSNEIHPKE